jgi:hypothetical protein
VPRIVEALRRRGHGTLCFHGPPGTGKTALAEHIAAALQRPLMIRQASDMASKFVGETEQNMARMFEEATAEQARAAARRGRQLPAQPPPRRAHYEVTEVNEMLQGMERFAGIFVCTTNLFEDLDEAALRRFTFKIRFHPLTAAQRERMFVAEALAGDGRGAGRRAAPAPGGAGPAGAGRLCRRAAAGRDPGPGFEPTSSWRSWRASTASSRRCGSAAASVPLRLA